MRRSILLTLVLILSGFGRSHAQYIPFDNYTVTENIGRKKLPASYINDIEQDQQGYLWLGTQIGVFRYNGYSFKSLTDEMGLTDNNINDIFVDSRNRIWIATQKGGIAVYDKGKPRIWNTENGLVSDEGISSYQGISFLEDKAGNVFYFSKIGFSVFREGSLSKPVIQNKKTGEDIRTAEMDSEGRIWLSALNKLYRYEDTTLSVIPDPLLDKSIVYDIAEDKPGSIWLATQNGIIHLDGQKSTVIDLGGQTEEILCLFVEPLGPDTVIAVTSAPTGIYRIVNGKVDKRWERGIRDFSIFKVFTDSRKRIWFATKGEGVVLIEDEEMKKYTTENNLVGNTIQKIFEDFNGNIWIATSTGLSKYGKVIFEVFDEHLITMNKDVLSIAELNQSIYLGTYSGLNIITDNTVEPEKEILAELNSMPNSDFYAIAADRNDTLWLATRDGITRIKDKTIDYISYKDVLPSGETELTMDLLWHNDTLYCASSYGLILYENGTFHKYSTEDSLADNWINALARDHRGNIWCGTADGLSIFDGTTFHNYNTSDGLPHNYLNDIAFEASGKAWIATDNGISGVILNPDWSISCENLNSSTGLSSDFIFSVLVDKKGSIWAGHNLGLNRIIPSTGEITPYGAQEGFIPVETYQGAATQTRGDELWFGTVSGAVKYIPENDRISQDPPLIYIESVQLYNDRADIFQFGRGKDEYGKLPENLSLPYHKNNLVFHFVGLHYTLIEENRYKYMLEGYDTEWSEITDATQTPPYRKLPPGKYVFKVMAANCDGVWTEKPAEFAFEIRPPFWKTWWFYTLEGLTGLLLLYLFIRLRERKLRHDKEVLKQKVKERTIEIEKQKDQIEFQKKEITDSILYAEKIQTAVLPKAEFVDTLLEEYFILFKPRDIVSGDFYWIHGKDGRVIVVAADCTGHGVPGAFMSMLGVSILNELASTPHIMSSDQILNHLREHLTKTLKQTGKDEDAKDGMDLALCILDKKNMEVHFSGAYNPLLHIREGECEVYKGDKMPVGFHMGTMKPFSSQTIKLRKGDCLYMFSDGYADQFGGELDKKFKTANLRELLTNIYYLPMTEQKMKLDVTIEDWRGINEQVDDILVIGIRV